jgi:antirestriction protein ArdC
MGKKTVYEIITEQILEKLEEGTVPWQRPWKGGPHAIPKNIISNNAYRGMNVLLLGMQGYGNPYWASFKQVGQMGGKVKKGEPGSMAIFMKKSTYSKEDETTGEMELREGWILRYYKVWNLDQTEGCSHKRIKELQEAYEKEEEDGREFNPIEVCETVVTNMPNSPTISNGVQQAYYRPSNDSINMPAKNSFVGDEEYYSVLFHEMSHSTGHESRLGRHKERGCGHHKARVETSKEELVAEMGSAFLCGHTGIERATIDNSAAYIASWLKALKNDPKMVVSAAAKAQASTDYILDN